VIGTSAQVYPASELPFMVKQNGGLLFEFNKDISVLSSENSLQPEIRDFFFRGDVAVVLPAFVRGVLA
jgi:NAD-dependent SIR2 family protein deacetylase